jgi:hypothetical protein
MPVRAVAFDIGGVLEVPTDTGRDGRWERRLGLQPGEFFERLRRSGLGRDANLGRVSEAESAQTLGRLDELDWPTTQELLADLWDWHYLLVVKANQPTLLNRCQRLPWHDVPGAAVPATAATAGSSCAPSRWSRYKSWGSRTPLRSKTRDLHANRWRTVTVYAITSLPFAQARPARLADLLRGHRAIEICQADCAYGM